MDLMQRGAIVAVLIIQGTCLMFPRRNVSLILPVSYPTGVSFYQLFTILTDNAGIARGKTVSYQINSVILQGKEGIEHPRNDIFTVNSSTGHLSLAKLLEPQAEYLETNFTIRIQATEKNVSGFFSFVLSGRVVNTNELCQPSIRFCFLTSHADYDVPESFTPNVIFDQVRPQTLAYMCSSLETHYSVSKGQKIVAVDREKGLLSFRASLDADQKANEKIEIRCSVRNNNGIPLSETFYLSGRIHVLDVNDNAPYMPKNVNSLIEVDANEIEDEGTDFKFQFNVFDKDSAQVNDIQARIENDPLRFFRARIAEVYDRAMKNETFVVILVRTVKQLAFSGPDYNFSVIIEDRGLLKKNNKVIYNVHVYNKTSAIICSATVSRLATIYSRVLQPMPVKPSDHWSFYLTSEKEDIFEVTPRTGIIYVADTKHLNILEEEEIRLNLSWNQKKTKEKNSVIILINVTDKGQKHKFNDCDFCAKNGEKDMCLASCGIGTARGQCLWRENHYGSSPTTMYATCSPDLNICPDGICDELEKINNHICPQDCSENLEGGFALSNNNKTGIETAVGTCTCLTPEICSCWPDREIKDSKITNGSRFLKSSDHIRQQKQDISSKEADTSNDVGTEMENQDNSYFVSGDDDTTTCGEGCIALIFLALCSAVVLCALLILIPRVRKYRKNKTKHKYVGSRMSLSVVPSDYVDERSSSMHDPQQTTSETSTGSSSKTSGDAQWEFPRDRLILEETLGEGEFGKVMRAQAWSINGQEVYSTVAVKMLKGDGSFSEQQDLLSEFNMLKEVCHPNVIKLLGACTQKGGPLYVIVEYAQFGSLRSYLRKIRSLGFECNDVSVAQVGNPMYLSDGGDICRHDDVQLTRRDLISFAWQIAKGMAYLSDMKLIHRDLATRNVLLATGNVVKISDFGLSRDVYEGDTYLKKSKGRVPVKWMAIESLEDQIYTSKSDVWSFGVVLWEIVTLGASPYPGISPERLYQLLKAGYRMEQPETCSDQLYRIMVMCWRDNPRNRPSFKELVHRFDRMLQDTTEYLDLSPIQNENDSTTLWTEDEHLAPLATSSVEKPGGRTMQYSNVCQSHAADEPFSMSASQESEAIELISKPSDNVVSEATV
ncbi:proto-oncogene tyrosine-protein kinase receptor Ret-like [Limulus polyphemus]|uniref:Proto-oncogene tyrosine-protein kinase receptor Ret-like n=1 Tax=Limulus polyphemus TaxID=6850 RepID=A0ABM1T9S3_LIMPO|nr:proto-oncogene tyrosine-protein kinase receptor Ret-like [Limulus polyphemus]